MKRFISLLSLPFIKGHFLFFLCLIACFVPAQNVSPEKTMFERELQWISNGNKFTEAFAFHHSDYNYYKNLPKKQPYTKYASELETHSYLLELAKQLDVNAQKLNFTRTQLAQYLIDFVQQAIPYKTDPKNDGFDYPKYPIETIVEAGGDCEDKAALLVALLKTFGFDAVFIQFTDHMGVGLQTEKGAGSYFLYKGKKYYYVESTSPKWAVGMVPPEYKKAIVKVAPQVKRYTRMETQFSPVAKSSKEKEAMPKPATIPSPTTIPVPGITTTGTSGNATRSTVVITMGR